MGSLPDSHPLSVFPGFYAGLRADAVLLLGVRLDFMMGYGRMFPKRTKVIQVDIEPSRLGFNRGPDCAVAGDVAHVLEDLQEALPKTADRPWAKEAKKAVQQGVKWGRAKINLDAVPCHPLRVAEELRDFGGKEACYVIDGGFTSLWSSEKVRPWVSVANLRPMRNTNIPRAPRPSPSRSSQVAADSSPALEIAPVPALRSCREVRRDR